MAELQVDIAPTQLTVKEGESATFEAKVEGGRAPYTYVWLKNALVIPGAVNDKYVIDRVSMDDHETAYAIDLTDADGTTAGSGGAMLFVEAAAEDTPGTG